MVSLNGVDDDIVFLIALGKLNAELDMRTLLRMVNSLTDIVEKSGTLRKLNVGSELGSHKTCDIGNLKRMVQNVLTVAGTVF